MLLKVLARLPRWSRCWCAAMPEPVPVQDVAEGAATAGEWCAGGEIIGSGCWLPW